MTESDVLALRKAIYARPSVRPGPTRKLADEVERLRGELDAARARVAEWEPIVHAARAYVMSGMCGDTAEHQREALNTLIEVARTDR